MENPTLKYKKSDTFDAKLEDVFARCTGAYSDITLRGYRRDLEIFAMWCSEKGEDIVPASSDTVAAFLDDQLKLCKIATLKRRLAAIGFLHRFSDAPDPSLSSTVQLALRRAARAKPRRPQQVQGLTSDILNRTLEACPATPIGTRDAALIAVGYDTLCRSVELAALQVDHVELGPSGGRVLILRSKGDFAGDGRIAYLSERTRNLLERWLVLSEIESGPLFRGFCGRSVRESALDTSTIRRLIKRVARRANLPENSCETLSGHSMRVGAAQDMLSAGFDSLAIMQSGGWKTPQVVLRYVENASTQALHQERWTRINLPKASNSASSRITGSLCSDARIYCL